VPVRGIQRWIILQPEGSHEPNQVGPIHTTAEKAKTLHIGPIVGGIFTVYGIVSLVVGKKKRRGKAKRFNRGGYYG
jgi:hypothetical protein